MGLTSFVGLSAMNLPNFVLPPDIQAARESGQWAQGTIAASRSQELRELRRAIFHPEIFGSNPTRFELERVYDPRREPVYLGKNRADDGGAISSDLGFIGSGPLLPSCRRQVRRPFSVEKDCSSI